MATASDQHVEPAGHAVPIQWSREFLPQPLETLRLLEEVRNALGRDPAAARVSVDRLATLLGIGAGAQETLAPARGGLTAWQRRKIEAHIEERLGGPIPIKTLADLVFMSSGHFGRVFKGTFGSSPHAHIIRRRIARAKEIMLMSREPLGQIALACGFADQAHFTTHFRRLVGKTPSDWRRMKEAMLP